MDYLIGCTLALAVAGYATLIGFDRERVFYPTLLIIIGSYYVLFATMGASGQTLIIEILIGLAFVALATAGFKGSAWLICAGMAAHGVLDLFHQRVIDNPGVPIWWPGFCSSFDITAAACVAAILYSRRNASIGSTLAARQAGR